MTFRIALAVAFLTITALASVAAPLLIYSVSLAAFGLPHVLAELRYVDCRFLHRWKRGFLHTIWTLLILLVVVRALPLAHGALASSSVVLQLVLLAALIAVTLPVLMRKGLLPASLGLGVLLAVGVGVLLAPVVTLVVLAFLHNLTPIGFLAERFEGAARRRVMLACALGFVFVPIVLATGLPFSWMSSVGLTAVEASLFALGPLEGHLGVFVPPGWEERTFAVHLFSAAVYLQCLHYAVVIHVLPRLLPTSDRTRPSFFVWPAEGTFRFVLGVAGALFLVGFALSFNDARGVYGVFASVHAWIEVPVLLTALALPDPGRAT